LFQGDFEAGGVVVEVVEDLGGESAVGEVLGGAEQDPS
jgi:hypothetical protein